MRKRKQNVEPEPDQVALAEEEEVDVLESDDPKEVFPELYQDQKDANDTPEEPEAEEPQAEEPSEPAPEKQEAEAGDDQPAEEGEEPESEQPTGQPVLELPPELAGQTMTLDGEKLTYAEIIQRMAADPTFATRMLTRAEQTGHMQRLYEEMRAQAHQQQQQAQPQQPGQQAAAPQDPTQNILESLHAYRPAAKQFVETLQAVAPDDPIVEGFQTLSEIAPGVLETMIALFNQQQAVSQVVGAMFPLIQEQGLARFEQEKRGVMETVVSEISSEFPDLDASQAKELALQAVENDPVLSQIPPQALWSEEAKPLIRRAVQGLLFEAMLAGKVKAGGGGNGKARKTRKRAASGPPSGSVRAPQGPKDLREQLFGGDDEE